MPKNPANMYYFNLKNFLHIKPEFRLQKLLKML